MRYYTHASTTFLAGTAAAPLLGAEPTAAFTTALLVGSVLPDIDEPNSYVGRRLPLLSYPIKLVFGHRGGTHSLLFLLLLGLVSWWSPWSWMAGLTLGAGLHILQDAFSKQGVPLLLPFSRKNMGIPLYRVGGWLEHLFFAGTLYLIWLWHFQGVEQYVLNIL